MYGSSRLGIFNHTDSLQLIAFKSPGFDTDSTFLDKDKDTLSQTAPSDSCGIAFLRGIKRFELSNHLGNVLAVISDRKLQVLDGGMSLGHYFSADIWSARDYYPFGMRMGGRSWQAQPYRFGFNGKEKDDEVNPSYYPIGARSFDARIGRWWSIDPKTSEFPGHSPYSGNGNNPILFIDPNGEQIYLPPNSHYNEQIKIILSLITGYVIDVSDKITEFSHPRLGNISGQKIIATTEKVISDRVIPGYGTELYNILHNTDEVKILADLKPIDAKSRVNPYRERDKDGLVFNPELFEETTDIYIAHLLSHELNETLSLAKNGWDDSSDQNYEDRDHKYAWERDLFVLSLWAFPSVGSGSTNFDRKDAMEWPSEFTPTDRAIYSDSGNKKGSRHIKFYYFKDMDGKYKDVIFKYFPPGTFNSKNEINEDNPPKGVLQFPQKPQR